MAQTPVASAVLFDLDNTLHDRDAAFQSFCRSLFRESAAIRRTHTEEEAVALMVKLDDAGERSRRDFFADIIHQWPGVYQDAEEAVRSYAASYTQRVSLDSATKHLLQDLRSRNIPWGIVTNGGADTQRLKVNVLGLDGLTSTIVISGELGFRKPDPEIFQRALVEIGAEASVTIFVGDNPAADIMGAAEAGMRTAWLHRGRLWPDTNQPPDHILDHVSEVRGLLHS